MLRVVQVSFHVDALRRSGTTLLDAWPTLSGVAAGVARAGVDVCVVQAAPADETIERDGVAYHFVDDGHRAPLRVPGVVTIPARPSRIVERVIASGPDVVHVHGLNHPLATRRLAGLLGGVPMLVQDHGTREPMGWRRRAWRWAYAPVAGLVFTAREQVTPFVRVGAMREDISVFEAFEGSSSFVPGDREAAQRATGMSGDPCVLWTGRLDTNKDPFTMLAAFERAAPSLPNARLWCCFGKAPLLDDVRARIESSAVLRERVTLVGTRPHAEMEQRYRAADFFVQTSHREAGCFSLIEALACGTTPLVTDIPAARRIVGEVGALAPVGDAEALAGTVVVWAGRDRATLRAAARARFDAALTYDAIGCQLRAGYEAVARNAAVGR